MSKISIVRCKDYASEKVIDAVFRSVDLLGGIGSFAKRGDNILIKPNLISARYPDEAVTTHPEVVRAAIRLAKDIGATPLVGDSPGTFFTIKDVDYVYEKTGIKSVTEQENAKLVRLDKSRIINGYPIAETALNASLVISLPKLKTHVLTVMTGAIKNTYGLIPGHFKVECHRNHPKPRDFVKVILDVYEITKPRLSIMDGVVAMEGDGPSAGRPKEIGLILAGADAVSLDRVVSELLGLLPHYDIIINEARRRGIGEANINNIQILGESLKDIKIKDFKLPKTAHRVNLLPDFLADAFTRAVDFRPFIDENLCRKCEICKDSCSVDAITINEATSRIDNSICIKCFCCHEVCPYKAIFIRRNFFTNLLWRS